jgi:polar amino acid transport system substrate-binding protein
MNQPLVSTTVKSHHPVTCRTYRYLLLVVALLAVGLVLAACQNTAAPQAPAPPTPIPVVATAAPTSPAPASGEVILTTGDWPPYVFETGNDKGPMVDIVVAAFKEAGITPKIVFYPWKRAEDEVRQGKAFAAFPYSVSDERKKEFDFSDPMYDVKAKFFYNKKYHSDGMPFEKLEDLRNYKIGGLLGSWYEPYFKNAGLQVEYVNATDQNVQKLALGRIDLTVEEENTTRLLIRKLFPNEADQFATLEKPLEQPGVVNELSLLVSRGYPNSAELLKQFNTGLAAIRANGTFKQILEKYQIAVQ